MIPVQSLRHIADEDFDRLSAEIPLTSLAGKTVLITGATGFFGAWLLSAFDWMHRMRGSTAHVLAVSRDASAFLARHPDFRDAPWLTWITGDVRDFPCPDRKIDMVLHAATDTSAAAGRNPALLFSTIVDGTRHVLECARRTQASRILLVSSGAAYGGQGREVTHVGEDAALPPPRPQARDTDPYGEGKREMESMAAAFAAETGASVVIARCFAFVGAGLPLDGHFAIGNFIRDALSQDRITIRSGGTAERSYLYAADLAIWLLRLLVSDTKWPVYNVGSDQALSIADLARVVVRTLAPSKLVSVEGWDDPANGRHRYIPSVKRARDEIGLEVWTDLAQAIARTAAWRISP